MKKYVTQGDWKFMFLIMFLIFGGSVAFFITNDYKIEKLQQEIDSMPHYAGWNESNNTE